MARLTNRQMEVLAERVTDLLEEQHKIENAALKASTEYIDFDRIYTDNDVEKLKEYTNAYRLAKDAAAEMEETATKYRKLAAKVGTDLKIIDESNYYFPEPKVVLEKLLREKKDAKYKGAQFNRDKTLRRVQADILLSDVQNPEELVRSLVEKLKAN